MSARNGNVVRPFYRAPSVIDAARALTFRLWLGRHYNGKGCWT